MVDAIVSVFLDKLVPVIAEEGRILIGFQDQFLKVKRKLELIQAFSGDPHRLKRTNEAFRVIIDRLRELVYTAEDILAACTCVSAANVIYRYKLGRELRGLVKEIEIIEGDMNVYLNEKDSDPPNGSMSRAEVSSNDCNRVPNFDETKVVGLENATSKLKDWLFQEGEGLVLIGIVGMGGLGKTTTAEKIFNDKEVKEHFDKTIWVSVSQPVQEKNILRDLLKELGGDFSMEEQIVDLRKSIRQYLSRKRYFIVLDDVWGTKGGWWRRLVETLPENKGSFVMITTRKEDLVRDMGVSEKRIHRPSFLTEDESWSLFSKVAFKETPQDTMLIEIANAILDKCAGLPLAIKAVGGVIYNKPATFTEWKRIAENFGKELSINEDKDNFVMASLQLSYDELPTYLKPCFLCFALYPEDSIIVKDQMIRWWIGEGFVPTKNGWLSVSSGEDCFMNLVNRCLVEVVDKDYNGKVITCKIHDLVRDLALQMAQLDAFSELKNESLRRWRIETGIASERLKRSKTKLRCLVSTTNNRDLNQVGSDFLKEISNYSYLRILDLSESLFEANANNKLSKIGSLQLITYLSLRNTHPLVEVPRSVKKLMNLLVLDLSFCQYLKTLPKSISNLSELLILDVSCCGSLKHFPKGLKKLTKLQVLKGFKPSKQKCDATCRIKDLKGLQNLQTLEMLITRTSQISSDDYDALTHLKKLRDFCVNCYGANEVDLVCQLENLSLPSQLQELTLKSYPGDVTPQWLTPKYLPQLLYLYLSSGNFKHFHPDFLTGSSWTIEGLMLELLPNMEAQWHQIQDSMRYLRHACVRWCSKLTSFPIDDVEFKGGVWRK